jgi:hypothetical protein
MSNHQQINIVRDTAESNNEVDALQTAVNEQAQPPQAEVPATPERPEWLPEKFQNPADLAKAYGELEKKFASKGADLSGLDQFNDEFAKTGDLSEESIKKVAAMGIPEPLVRAYVEGQKAVTQTNINSVMGLAGGEAQYQALTEWASSNISEDEVDAFNNIMESGNMNTIKMAVAGLKARYEQANGASSGRLIQGEVKGPSGGAFRSIAEIVEAMKDPRYAKDPAYRSDVEKRVALSNALGVSS